MDREIIEKVTEIISTKNSPTGINCVLSLIDLDGYPTASAIQVSKSDGINRLTFSTSLDSNKIKRIEKNGRASVCFFQEEPSYYNITFVGKIEVSTDADTKRENWTDFHGEVFAGPDDESYCVLKFATERYKFFIDGKEVEGKIQ
ncbi:MAG: pyridoxamine 5'-phosphate oxidase family protein [Treponema sp.]|nr:pyridoxamine 5'-phosphate oxidase family protein [Treponema sp.]